MTKRCTESVAIIGAGIGGLYLLAELGIAGFKGLGSGVERRGRREFAPASDDRQLPSAPWHAQLAAASNRPCLVIPTTKVGENPVVCRARG